MRMKVARSAGLRAWGYLMRSVEESGAGRSMEKARKSVEETFEDQAPYRLTRKRGRWFRASRCGKRRGCHKTQRENPKRTVISCCNIDIGS